MMRKTFAVFLALLITAAAVAGVAPLRLGFGFGGYPNVTPLSLPLVQSNSGTFTFLGSFKAPTTFTYESSAMSVSGTTLYMSGLYYYNSGSSYVPGIGSMTIPTLSGIAAYDGSNGTATTVVAPTTPHDGGGNPTLDMGGGVTPALGNMYTGSLVYGGKLYLTNAIGFDAANQQNAWIFSASTNLATFHTPNSASSSLGTANRFFSGPLGLVPSAWQPYLGGPAYIANGLGLSIASLEPSGFSFATFDPANVADGGGVVSVTELQDYFLTGFLGLGVPVPQQLAARSFSGPFGSGVSLTLSGGNGTGPNGLTGATAATLSSPLSLPSPAENLGSPYSYRYQVTFSDGEQRDVNLTNANGGTGSPSIPDGVVAATFSALTCVACTTSVTIRPYGDNYVSLYDGPTGYGFFAPGSKSFLYISLHQYGPLARRVGVNPCDMGGNASSNNAAPYSPDTNAYYRLQVTAYDVSQSLYLVKQGSQAVYTASPYAEWDFPNWQNLVQPGRPTNCLVFAEGLGAFFFDPATNILYGTTGDSFGNGSGQNIIYEWQVNSLLFFLLAVVRRRAANDNEFARAEAA